MSNQVLLNAATILEERGWIRKFLLTKDGCCVAGAIKLASKNGEEFNEAKKIFKARIDGEVIGFWNDAPERTLEEVLSKLRMED